MADAVNTATLSRRTVVSLLAAAAAVPTLARCPTVFDAKRYIADLGAAGVQTVMHKGNLFFYAEPGRGFGSAFSEVQKAWAAAIDSCPDYIDRIAEVAPTYIPYDPF